MEEAAKNDQKEHPGLCIKQANKDSGDMEEMENLSCGIWHEKKWLIPRGIRRWGVPEMGVTASKKNLICSPLLV